MTNICFWNINKKKNKKYLEYLVNENDIDILILSEDTNNFEKIGSLKIAEFCNDSNDIKFYHKSKLILKCSNNQEKYKSYKVKIGNNDIYIFGIHLPSNIYRDELTRMAALNSLKADLEGKNKYILCGDFNSSPFDITIISALGLSALPCTYKPTRIISGEKYTNLYNPMWRFFDDFEKIPGTYYYNNSNALNYYWYIFDQVMFSYGTIGLFDNDSLKIIKNINNRDLIKNKKIDKEISDHLPIVFSIKEEV